MGSFIICTQHQILLGRSIKENEVGGACGTHGRGEKRVQGFDGKVRRKKALGRPMRRWEDGIKVDLREIGLRGCGVDSPGSG
jgi:hypothetical protein